MASCRWFHCRMVGVKKMREQIIEKVLEHKTAICYRNEMGEQYGAWYKADCICAKSKAECVPETRMRKGCNLVEQLPVCYLKNNLAGDCEQTFEGEKKVHNECIKKYKEVETAFKEYGYIG